MAFEHLFHFSALSSEFTGKLVRSRKDLEAEVILGPGNRTTFGPMPEPLPRYLLFELGTSYAVVGESRTDLVEPLSEELIVAGIHGLLLLDPRVYTMAHDAGLLEIGPIRRPAGQVLEFQLTELSTLLGMPEEVAAEMSEHVPGTFRTTARLRQDHLLQLLINKSLPGMADSYAEYDLDLLSK